MNSKGLCVLLLSVVGPSYISLTAVVVAGGGGDILSRYMNSPLTGR